jgi:anti-anti-sigma factor
VAVSLAFRPGNGTLSVEAVWAVTNPFPFTAEVAFRDGTAVVTVRGDADITATAALAEILTLALDKNPRHLAIDLSAVGFLDCAAARAIATAGQALPPGRFTLRTPSPPAARVLQLMGLTPLIEDARIEDARMEGESPALVEDGGPP